MGFDYDAFISYSHIDNVGLVDGSKGWITNLHRALEVRIGQLLGEKPQIWRDPKLSGNDVFEITLVEQLKRVAVLVTVVSPRYIKSEWTKRELVEFWKAAQLQGGVTFHDKARIFKVLKTPIPHEMDLPELAPLLGYEFFKIDETGRVRELDEVFGAQAQRDFWMKLDDLAHDITALLEMLRREFMVDMPDATNEKEAVFLAETTFDLREQREAIRRDLQQHGYTVLPSRGLPLVASEMKASFEEDLAQCRMSIHLIGKSYGLVPEGSDVSLTEIQNELAIDRGKLGGFMRLLWVPSGIQIEDERQAKVVDRLRREPVLQGEADLLETFFEDLRTVIYDRLKEAPPSLQTAMEEGEQAAAEKGLRQIYLIYDQRDAASARSYGDTLFDQGFEVLHPTLQGDEAEVRLCHEENLRVCDGALIFFGATNEAWVRRKLREIQKSVGYGRTGPLPAMAIACLAPMTDEKQRFRIHNTLVINQMNDFSADLLEPFISRLRS